MKKTLILILSLFLILPLVSCSPFHMSLGGTSVSYENASAYSEGPVPSDAVFDTLYIDWVAGSVTVDASEDGKVSFSETGETEETLRYLLEDGKLTVRFCRSGVRFKEVPEKKLSVSLPASLLKELRIETVSSSVRMVDVSASEKTVVESVSGLCHFSGTTTKELQFESVSGSLEAEGNFGSVSSSTVSGNTELILASPAASVSLESVSGSATLFFPESSTDGYSVDSFESLSGKLDGETSSGEGKTRISFESMSGDLHIGTYR